jgi:heparanase 1
MCNLSLQGGVTILLINLSKLITYKVSTVLLTAPSKTSTTRLEYHLTAANGDLHSQVMLLNGNALGVTLDRNIPTLTPVQVDSSTPISVAPLSIVFAQLPDAGVQICGS